MLTTYDSLERRCPTLGHQINFSYCRTVDLKLPCKKILDCWFQYFDIQDFVKLHYSEEVLQRLLALPKPKIFSILEIVEKVKVADEK